MAPPAVARAVAAAFNDAQRSAATHRRASRALVAAHAADPRAFLDAFLHALNRALVVFAREPAVERVVAFVATFAAQRSEAAAGPAEGAERSFSTLVLSYLLDQSGAASKAVRFRACQTLSAALAALPEETDIDADLWEPLQAALMRRASDKLPRVRAAAASALCRLQTTGDPADDEVTAALVALLSADSSASVRKAALAAVAVTPATRPAILRRTRDVKEDVRRAAYATLAAKLHPGDLELDARVALLRAGLKDRTPAVRAVAAEQMLVTGWLEGACGSNVFDLVELLGCEAYEEDVLLALRVVFASPKRAPLLASIEIDVDNLTPDDVLILRAMCDVKAATERLEQIIPSTTEYAEVLKYYSVDEFASRNLLAISRRVDLADEAGRRALELAIRSFFLCSSEVAESVIPDAVAAMRRTMLSEDDASRVLVEVILNDVLGGAEEDCDGASDGGGNPAAADEWSSMRALGIAKELLRESTPVDSIADSGNGLFLSLVQQVVIPRLTSSDGGQRHASLECLALFCLLDSSGCEARRHVPLFVQACRNDNEDIQVLALHILADLFMAFDFSTGDAGIDKANPVNGVDDEDDEAAEDDEFFSANGDSPGSRKESTSTPGARHAAVASPATQVVTLFSDYITHVDAALRTAAAEALARLLFSRRVLPSAKLLSRLMLAYYNPVNEESETMRQCLCVFFPALAFSSPHHRVALEKAFLPTLRVLIDAPSKSPLSTVQQLSVAQYFLHLTNPSSVSSPEHAPRTVDCDSNRVDIADTAATTHERITESLLHQILDLDDAAEIEECRLYVKILASIRLIATPDTAVELKRLRKLTASAVDKVQDRRSLVQLRKFDKHISALAGGNDDDITDDDSSGDASCAGEISEGQENVPEDAAVSSAETHVGGVSSTSSGAIATSANREARILKNPSTRARPARQSSVHKSSPLAERVLNLSDEDDGATDDEGSSVQVVDVKPPPRMLPRRATRARSSIVDDVIDIDLESEDNDSASDESYALSDDH